MPTGQRSTGYVETPYDPEHPYAGSVETDPESHPESVKPAIEGRSGWNPYRGSEQHGVQQTEQIPMPVDDWERESNDELEARTWHKPKIRDAEPTPTVKGWSKEVAVVVTARTSAITLQRNTWTKILDKNNRRQMISLWLTDSPTGSDVIYFQTGKPNLPTALCPRIQDGGQQFGLYQFLFTDELYMYAETSDADYVVSIIEEYEVEA
jgi:hypothetical protein